MYLRRLTLLYSFLFFVCLNAKAQVLPLSRSDSGRVILYQNQYEAFINANSVREASDAMNKIGYIYWNANQYRKAIYYYEKSLALNAKIENSNGIAMLHNNLGMLYADVQEYEKALSHFSLTLVTRRLGKEPVSIIATLVNRATVYNNLKKYNLAVNDLKEALNLSLENKLNSQLASSYAMLSETYDKMGNAEEARKYFDLFKSFNDLELKGKIVVESYKKQLAEKTVDLKAKEVLIKQYELEIEKKKLLKTGRQLDTVLSANSDLKEEINIQQLLIEKQENVVKLQKERAAVAEAQKEIYKRTWWLSLAIMLLVMIIAVLVYVNNRKIREQNQQLQEQNEAIAKQKEQLAVSNDVKNKIFSIIAHDLRGPIASLNNFFMLLEDFEDIPDEVREILEELSVENSQISTILENLLNWAKTQMAELRPVLKPVEVRAIVEENVNLLQRLAEGKNITLLNQVPSDLIASSDTEMTKIVFRNLMQNAIKFTKAKGTVKIEGRRLNGDLLEFKVIDSGVGMSEDKVQTLFNLKSNKSTFGTNNEKGTGLGLVLCNDFVKICGGSLAVSSELNVGTTITVTLNANK